MESSQFVVMEGPTKILDIQLFTVTVWTVNELGQFTTYTL